MIAEASSFSQADSNPPRSTRIVLLGCGAVGIAVARLLRESRSRLRDSHGVDLELTRILVRDASRPRDGVESRLLTGSIEEVLASEPDIVIEALGGCDPALAFVSRALHRGISVASANKTLVAHHGLDLRSIASRTGARFAYEACVGAAVPVLAAIRQRTGDPLVSLRAVLNGTCNFVLSRMRETGSPLNDVLSEAIARGLAEPDPTADISGRDSAEKLCILAREAGYTNVSVQDIDTTGIERITPRDLDAAREQGCVVRLIGEISLDSAGEPLLRVCPMFVPQTHPLAKVKEAQNVFVVEQRHAGRLILHGEGAGPAPTAAAIVGDVLNTLDAAPRCAALATAQRDLNAPRRTFVRIARTHHDADDLRRRASHVHLRPNSIEAIVNGDAGTILEADVVAPILAG